jgi:hypothetical protein
MKRDVPHFRIGLLLTEAGIIAPKQLDEAIRQGEQAGTPFLRILVGSGELKQHELQAVIRAQSLIWSGMLDVERAIKALTIVHSTDVSIDEGLRSVGWMRAESTMGETLASTVQTANPERAGGNGFPLTSPVICQYCGTTVDAGSKLCPFCTGEAQRISARVHIEPAWQKQAVPSEGARIVAAIPARDPLLMAFLSGCCLAGLGQMVIGQSAKGFSLLFLALIMAFGTGGMSCLLVFPLAGLDAYLLADKLRNGKTVGQWEFF